MRAIILESQWLDEIKRILKETAGDLPAYIFGSRVGGRPRRYSDVDLCLKGDTAVPLSIIGLLQERFEESNIPYVVDPSDYFRLPPEFQGAVDRQGVRIN